MATKDPLGTLGDGSRIPETVAVDRRWNGAAILASVAVGIKDPVGKKKVAVSAAVGAVRNTDDRSTKEDRIREAEVAVVADVGATSGTTMDGGAGNAVPRPAAGPGVGCRNAVVEWRARAWADRSAVRTRSCASRETRG